MMCHHFGVSHRGYGPFGQWGPSQQVEQDHELAVQIRAIHQRSRGTCGRPRVQAALRSEGVRASSKRVGRLMKQEGLQARRSRRMRSTTDSGHKRRVAENVLARAFRARAPNEAWVGDIPFIPKTQGWLYLAVPLDLFSRRVTIGALPGTKPCTANLSASGTRAMRGSSC